MRWWIVCLLLAALFTAAFAIWYANPTAIVNRAVHADTSLDLSFSRGHILLPGHCLRMRWEATNALRILVDDELLPASGERQLCVDAASQPALQVMLLDGSEVVITQSINILSASPAFLIAALITIALAAAGFGGLLSWAQRHVLAFDALRSAARLLAWAALSIGITLLIIEVLLRTYLGASGSREQKIMYLYSLAEIRALQSNILPLPYISYAPDPAYAGHNRLGYRGPEIAIPKPPGVYRIVAVGGSTTYSTGTSAEDSYPARLQAILRDDYGYSNVEIVNAGVSGYTSWEILSAFAFRILELEPDMLIYYGAVNDLVVRERLSQECYRGLNAQRGLNGQRGLFVERNAELPISALYRLAAISLGWMRNPLALDSSFEPSRVACQPDPGHISLADRLAINTPSYYERNIQNLMILARANDTQPVISSWVYNVAAERPDLWRESIAEHNAVTRRLALELDAPYIDLAADFPVDNALWEADGVHLLAAGAYEQASRYAAFLDANQLLPRPQDR